MNLYLPKVSRLSCPSVLSIVYRHNLGLLLLLVCLPFYFYIELIEVPDALPPNVFFGTREGLKAGNGEFAGVLVFAIGLETRQTQRDISTAHKQSIIMQRRL